MNGELESGGVGGVYPSGESVGAGGGRSLMRWLNGGVQKAGEFGLSFSLSDAFGRTLSETGEEKIKLCCSILFFAHVLILKRIYEKENECVNADGRTADGGLL